MNFILYSNLFHLFETNSKGIMKIKNEVLTWIDENNINVIEECFCTDEEYQRFGLLFDSEIDLMAFKLRWC